MPVSVPIERAHEGLTFRDQIILTDDEAAALTPADIEALANARFESWRASLTADEE